VARSDADKLMLARHEAARQVLRESDEQRVPLVVYLRKFDIHVLHGATEVERKFGEVAVLEALPAGARLVTVQEEPSGEEIRGLLARRVPALRLGEGERWRDVLLPILARADLIISEFGFLSPGVRWELDTCRRLRKHNQTVLVLPPHGSRFATLDHLAPIDQFPRVLWADQLFDESIAESFVARDLIERLATLAGLAPAERKRLHEEDRVLELVPVSCLGLLEAYRERANRRQIDATFAAPEARAAIDYYRFWDWWRVAAVLGVLVHDTQELSMDEAAEGLAWAYIDVLQGVAHGVVELDQDGSFLTREVILKLAGSLDPLIARLAAGPGREALSRLADATLARLGLRRD
jgi:hypothetical protein